MERFRSGFGGGARFAGRVVWLLTVLVAVGALALALGPWAFLPEGGSTAQAAEVIDTATLRRLDDRTRITLSAFRYNRVTQTYLGTATVTNISAEPLDAPLYLVVAAVSPTEASVVGAPGLTTTGQPYYPLAALPAGATSSPLTVQMKNPTSTPIQLTVQVYGLPAANRIPVAEAGPDQSIRVGETVELDGSASHDQDGDLLTFQWRLVSAPPGSLAVLSDPTAVNPRFTADFSGEYRFELVVNDGQEDSVPDQVRISTVNSAPVADAGPDQTVPVGARVTLDGSASHDVDGDALTYHWTLTAPTDSTAVLDDPTAVQPHFTVDVPGAYVAVLVVNDGELDSVADRVTITTENSRPVACPGPDQSGLTDDQIHLDGRCSQDADGDPLSFRWSLASVPPGGAADLVDTEQSIARFTAQAPGFYVVQLIVSDGSLESIPVTVSIQIAARNHPPVITSTPVTTATATQLYGYAVEAHDPDAGDTLTYSLLTAPVGMTLDAASGLIQWTPTQAGGANVQVQVQDAGGLSDTQSFVITIAAAPPLNQSPTLTSTPVTTATAGQPYTYDVEATDPDAGDVLTFSLPTAPAGMTINATSGLIEWTPTTTQVGDQAVTVRVTDPGGQFDEQTFTLTVESSLPTNQPPVISFAGIAPQWIPLNPPGTLPAPRLSSGSGYDAVNDRLIVFGGEATSGKLNDVWVLVNATGANGAPTWVQLAPIGGPPRGRHVATTVYDPTANRLIVYGGCASNCAPSLSDAWVLTNANGLGGTPEWIQLPSGPTSTVAGAAYDPISNRMMVFGGLATEDPYSAQNRVLVLVDANGIGDPHWIALSPNGNLPSPRSDLSIAYDQNTNRLIVFGGYSNRAEDIEFNDVWVLTNANGLGGTAQWQPLNPLGVKPPIRSNIPYSYDPNSNRLIVFGGNTRGTGSTYNDSWVLTNANGLGGTPDWIKLNPPGSLPKNRFGQASAYDTRTNRLVVSLGDYYIAGVASEILNDAWVLTNASGLCTAGQPCTFQVTASDPDAGDTLTYALDTVPAGMTIDAASGAMVWTPTIAQIGDHPVAVRVTDRGGLTATQSFTATVASVAVPNLVGLAPEWAESFINAADLAAGTKTSQGGAITLNFDSLPSRQGWSYVSPNSVPEQDVFSVDGGTLFQNSLNTGFAYQGGNGYGSTPNVIDRRLPLQIAVRARVLEENGDIANNSFGYCFGVDTGSETFGHGFGTSQIQDMRWYSVAAVPFDNTLFHDYQLQARPGIGYELVIDGNLVTSGPSVRRVNTNYISWGDGTGGTNARAETTAFSFTQPRVVGQNPPAGTLVPNQTAVDLTLVDGPATETVPNLTGLTQAQASAAILAANLTVGATSSAPSATIPVNQVSDQSPLPNIHIPKNTPVNLVLSTGPPQPTNHPPTITSTPVTTATAGQPYTYDVGATDPDAGDVLTFSLPTAPAGMTINATSGLIEWTPTEAQVSDQAVTVRVTDAGGLSVEQSFSVTVEASSPTNQPPIISAAGIAPQWTQLAPQGPLPSARAHSRSGYDVANDRLIVFGGEEVGGAKLNEVWILVNAKGLAGAPAWVRLAPTGTPPAPRSLGAAAYDPTANRLIIHGGCTGNCGSVLSDAWVLTNANGLGGTPEWIQLPSGAPSTYQGSAYDPISNRLMVFGGLTQPSRGSETNAVRVLVDANGIGDPQWIDLAPPEPLPSPRSLNQDLGYDSITNRLIVFGGLSGGTTEFNDTWVLTNANGLGGTPAWQPLNPTGTVPSDRNSLPISYDPNSNRLIIFGGLNHFTDRGTYDDSWVLTHANGVGSTPQWLKLDAIGPLPAARRAYVSAYDPKTNRLVAAMGEYIVLGTTTTTTTLNDTWVLSNASGLCTAGQPCTFQVTASDPDAGDTLTYALDTVPAGMTIDAATGAMTWTPTLAQIGDHPVTVRVTDADGLTATQSFTATVAPVAVPNVVGLAPEWAESFIGAADLANGSKTSQGGAITLNFDSLPSRQGWTVRGGLEEVFSISEGVLKQDTTRADGDVFSMYNLKAVDPRLPFKLAARTRVLEGGRYGVGYYAVSDAAGLFAFWLNPGEVISTTVGSPGFVVAYTQDNTVFHDYLLAGQPGVGYNLSVDGTTRVYGGAPLPVTWVPEIGLLEIGDPTTTGGNARAEYAFFSFTQPRVVGQNPPAGTLTQNQTAVDLTIVDGPATETVPNLTGLTQAQASTAILAANLTVGAISSAPSATVPVDQVSDQSPLPNILVPKNTPVNFVLSTGPPKGGNVAPTITSTPITTATVGQPYTYDVDATDPDAGDTLTYALTTAPTGMTINASTGLIAWTPTAAQAGTQSITVRVTDQGGLFVEQSFTVVVSAAANQAPTITSTPVATATVGQPYAYDADATDPDGDPLTFALTTYPTGMVIDPTSGLIEWTPAAAQVGTQNVTVRVEDGRGGFATQGFTVTVAASGAPNHTPAITSTPPTGATVGLLYTYAVDATDPDNDPLSYALTANPTGMTLNATTGLIEWTPTAAQTGDHPVVLTVADGRGGVASQSYTLRVPAVSGTIAVPDVIGATLAVAETTLTTAGLNVGATSEVDRRITLDLTALPSAQSWNYGAFGNTAPETQVFTLDNGILRQNTLGLGVTQSLNLYQRAAGVHPTLPFVLTVTARVLQQEGGPTSTFGFAFGLAWGTEQIGLGLRTDGIYDAAGTVLSTTLDTTQFHTYRLEGAHESGYRLFVDGVLLGTVTPSPGNASTPFLFLGDASSTANAQGEIAAFDFVQGQGLVIDQQPVAAMLVVADTPVALTVASAPPPVIVPNVVGQPQTSAQTTLIAAPLLIGVTTPAPSATVPAGNIVSQTPAAGATVPGFTVVDLTVSTGPSAITTPNVVGLTQSAATTALQQVGLTLGNVTTQTSATVPAGQVISQVPAAGASVAPGTAVNLVVSSGAGGPGPEPVPDLAAILVQPASATILTGQTQTFSAVGILNNGVGQNLTGRVTWESSNPAVATLDAAGVATALSAGATTIRAINGTITGAATLTVEQGAPNATPPTAAITAPTDQATVTAPTTVVGTASDPEFLKYRLEMAPVGESAFTLLAEGTAPVTNGTLGTLDPTLLINDLYTLRLTVYDRGGNTTQTELQVQLAGEQKVGHFTLAFQDLSIPMACLPLTVTRVYDSRDTTQGDFGVGWRLDVQTLRLRETGTMGRNWAIDLINQPGPFGTTVPTYTLYDTAAHKVSLTLPDGHVEEFDLTPSPSSSQLNPIGPVSLVYTPRPGTLGSLAPVVTGSFAPSADTGTVQLINDDVEVLDPRAYRYTTPEGSVYLIDKFAGVQQVQCASGPTLTVTPNGIDHSDGKGVTFTRDAKGRITALTDPAGHVQQYAYDANGDLIRHTDPEAQATAFQYDYRHHLLEVLDPRGVRAVRNEYDTDGRLISTTDPLGQAVTFNHNLVARTETVTDRLGHATVYEYDDRGNVLRQVDPLGGVTTRTYDAFGNELTRTDPLGRTTTLTYDSRRNPLTETDPLGHVTAYQYNALNAVTRITDPLGRVTANTYNAWGNLLDTTDPMGGVTRYTYDTGGIIFPHPGVLTAKTDALGQVTGYAYNSVGDLIQETDPLGHVAAYTYDANGNRLSETRSRTVGAATETVATRFEYDGNNRLVRTTHPDGSTTRTEYNALGKQARTVDALGRATSYEYDDAGRMTRTVYPDGSSETSTYDAEGRRIASTDRAGRSTTYGYDALGRLIATTFPDGTQTTTAYDVAGQVTASTDAQGHTTAYQYDAAGRRTRVTDALSHTTTFSYDAAGNQTAVTDANSHTLSFSYDANNRRTRTTYPDGTAAQVSYNALGQQISKTDQAGQTTQYGHDALGRLISVTDALGQVTSYGYDEQGNQIRQTDANGHTTTFSYDAMGRRVSRTLPLGMTETMTYDVAGNLTGKTDFNGKTTTFSYDNLNRLIEKQPDPATGEPTVRFTYAASGQRARMEDARGVTTYSYDNRDRLTQKATPQGTLSYAYDAAGNLQSIQSDHASGAAMTYAYDVLNRLESVTDANGETTYAYDAVGNLQSDAYPNGVEHRYTYNTLNHLTDLTVARGAATLASYAYTLGPTGNRLSVTEHSGRTANYSYDALYRLTGETVSGDPGGVNGSIGYVYDPVGNRLIRSSTVAPIPAQTFSYDANDRITTEGYDDNGNTLHTDGRTFGYDTDNRLTSADGGVSFVYDGDGNRVARTAGGVTTEFLVDTLNPTGYSQVLEEIENGNVVRKYTYGLDLVSQEQASGVSYYGYDGHGSVRLLTDPAGNVTDTYAYEAFGNLVAQTGTTRNVYLYAGEQGDGSLNLYYLRARYLTFSYGRFLTRDPFEGFQNDPFSLRPYVFTNANPVNIHDPSGQITLPDVVTAATIRSILVKTQLRYLRDGAIMIFRTLVSESHFPFFLSKELHYHRNELFGHSTLPTKLSRLDLRFWTLLGETPTHNLRGNRLDYRGIGPFLGMQAIYDFNGDLVTTSEDGGSYDFYPPRGFLETYHQSGFLLTAPFQYAFGQAGHFFWDVLPWLYWGNTEDDSTTRAERFDAAKQILALRATIWSLGITP